MFNSNKILWSFSVNTQRSRVLTETDGYNVRKRQIYFVMLEDKYFILKPALDNITRKRYQDHASFQFNNEGDISVSEMYIFFYYN